MLREVLLVYLGVVGAIKILYELRGVSFVGNYLSTLVALVLIYAPVLHTALKKIPISFFEKGRAKILASTRFFAITSLVIFPPFLILDHFYQKIVFSHSFHGGVWENPGAVLVQQLFLVAFPEEFFFRGWLQPLIGRIFHQKIRPFGRPLFTVSLAVLLTSFLFAFSHSLITLRWWHFAIFFPSLVFGWLREKTGGLVAPILFHALSNIIIAWIGASYW